MIISRSELRNRNVWMRTQAWTASAEGGRGTVAGDAHTALHSL